MTDATAEPEVLGDNTATFNNPLPDQSNIPDESAPPQPDEGRNAADSVKSAMDKVLAGDEEKESDKAETKADDKGKPKAEAKTAVKAAAKPDEVSGEGGDDEADPKATKADAAQDQGRAVKAPARLLPKAREVWVNTPRAVQAEFERMENEHAAEVEKSREAQRFADEIKPYDDLARGAGVSLKHALDRYVALDRQIGQDFGRGVASIAQDQGKQPIEAIASLLRAYGLTPQQYAQSVTANPQRHQINGGAPVQQQAQRPDPAGQQALQAVQEIQRAMQIQQVETQVIAPIMPQMPRYAELQDDIAFFLKSGKVPTSLSPADRVLTAYDMADRINPAPVTAGTKSDDPDPPPANPAGRKSISGAPGNGKALKGKPKVMSLQESIDDAMRRV